MTLPHDEYDDFDYDEPSEPDDYEDRQEQYERECEMREAQNDPDSPLWQIDGVGFAEPGSGSALRAETTDNPRNLPCPNCGAENVLTPADRARGYQCDICADQAERGF